MQVFAVVARVLVAAFAVSAAKLPLPSHGGNDAAFNIPVPSQPSTLYEAPLEHIPVPFQHAVVVQTAALIPSIPAELSTLYEAPGEDFSSVAQPSVLVPHAGFPTSINIRVESIPAPVQQDVVHHQIQSGLVSVPAEPSDLFELPLETFSAPVQQPTIIVVSVPDQPSDLYEVPFDVLATSVQQPNVIQITEEILLVPADPATLHETPFANVPVSSHQSSLGPVPVLAEPSTLYDVPVENFASPSQETIFSQTQGAVSHGQDLPVNQFVVNNPSANSAPFNTQGGLLQGDITQSTNTFSQETLVSVEPSELYETPDAAFPAQYEPVIVSRSPVDLLLTSPAVIYQGPDEGLPSDDTFTPVQYVQQAIEPSQLYQTANQPILFPAEQTIQNPVFVPVPSVPSTLYGFPQ